MQTDRLLKKVFGFDASSMKKSTEIIAGVTTFLAMSYILAVNPSILQSAGMDKGALFTATALAAIIGTLAMAVIGKLPFGMAPGMGLNAFFTYTVCGAMGYSWQFALTAVLLEGMVFFILAVTNVWKYVVDAIPDSLKKAIGAGIGLFIAMVGLKSGGVMVDDPSTLIAMGDVSSGPGLLSMIGLLLTGLLVCFNVPGALLIGIIATTLIGIPMGITRMEGFASLPPSVSPLLCKVELSVSDVLSFDMLTVVLTFLCVDMFGTVGALVSLIGGTGLKDTDGRPYRLNQAFLANSIGVMAGALLGTSSQSVFVESASGVAQGGRSGLTALCTAVAFALALFFAPLFLAIPGSAVCPVLVIVGLYMLPPIQQIDLADYTESIPAFLCFILIPLTYGISNGIFVGVISYVVLNLCKRNFRKMTPLMYVLAVLFVLKFIFL